MLRRNRIPRISIAPTDRSEPVAKRDKSFQATNMEEMLAAAIEDLDPSDQASGATVIHGALPTVTADPTLLRQLLHNLIDIAIQSRQDDVPLEIHISAQRESVGWLFSLADNGIGMDTSQILRMFTIFNPLDPCQERPGPGAGLTICKRIVEYHGGDIWVTSTPGTGSTVYFTIPDRSLASPSPDNPTTAAAADSAGSASPVTLPEHPSRR